MIDDTGGVPTVAEFAVWLDFASSPFPSNADPSLPVSTSFGTSISGSLASDETSRRFDFYVFRLLLGFLTSVKNYSFT